MLYFCLLLYVALIYIRPAEIVPEWSTIPFGDILTAASLAVGLVAVAAKPRKLFNFPHDKLILGFWAAISVSAAKVWLTGVYYAWLAFAPVVFCYFLARAAIQTDRQFRGVFYLLVALNVMLAVNGIVQFHTGVGLGGVTMLLDRIYGTGIFNDPNDLGMSFVMIMPFVILMITSRQTGAFLKLFALASAVVIMWGLFYTNSRGALLGLGVALTWHTFMRFRSTGAMVAAIALVGLIAVAGPSRAGQINSEEESAQSRVQAWAAGWQMLKANPVTGVGYGQYEEYHERVAHNAFVHTFGETGLFGAFFFVGMFYWYFKGLSVDASFTPEVAAWHRAMIASGVGMLVCMWFLSRQYVIVLYLMLALSAVAMGLQHNRNQQTITSTGRDLLNVTGILFIGLVVVNVAIRFLAIWG
jgi:O-antigen ligase